METIYSNLSHKETAQSIAHHFSDQIRFAWKMNKWFRWRETHWNQEDNAPIFKAISWEAQRIRQSLESQIGRSNAMNSELWKWANSLEMWSSASSVAKMAETLDELRIDPEKFDSQPFLLNSPQGVIDLQTLQVHSHDPSLLMSKVIDCEFDPEAKCPRWKKFIEEVIPDPEVRRFLQVATGYSLTGDVSEQCLFFLWGTGANGKTTFVETIVSMLGPYAQIVDNDLLVSGNSRAAQRTIFQIPGRRFVSTSETSLGSSFDEASLKRLTGGDKVTARPLYGEKFTFTPSHKIWIQGNYKPQITGNDEGIWRRINLIEFPIHVEPAVQDRELRAKLEKELPGILNWALKGTQIWIEEGLDPPKEILSQTRRYRAEQDVFGDFGTEFLVGSLRKETFVPLRLVMKLWRGSRFAEKIPGVNTSDLKGELEKLGFEVFTEDREDRVKASFTGDAFSLFKRIDPSSPGFHPDWMDFREDSDDVMNDDEKRGLGDIDFGR